MINDGSDTNDRDQVTIEVPLPKNATIEIPIQSEESEDGYPQTPLSAPLISSPINNRNDHYDIISSPTRITTVTKTIDTTKKSKMVSKTCSLWCLLFSVLIVFVMVFLLVFGWHEKFSIGVFGASEFNGTKIGQGNLTMDYLKTDMTNTNTPNTKLILTFSSISKMLTSTPPPTQTADTPLTKSNLTFPFGFRQPIKSFTAEKQVQLLSPTTTVFEEMDKNVFGNMSIFLSDKNRFVISPFLLNYIVSFIGKFGDESTMAVIKDKYFGVNDINQIYNYYTNLKESFSSIEDPCFFLNCFISGDNPTRTDNPYKRYNFMEEIIEKDGIPFYPSSDNYYETYYNDRIRKNSFDKKSRREFFVNKELKTTARKVVGFSHLQKSLKFKNVTNLKIVNQKFNGLDKQYTVDMFVNDGHFEDFEEHRLYQIPFADEKYTFFIVHNRYNSSIPNITLSDILKTVKIKKSNTAENESAICIPEISQQSTYDFSRFINLSVGKELSIMFNQPFDNQILDKYYQAIRFDVRAEGVNIKEREHKYGKFKCESVDRTFIYGVFYNDKENLGHESLLYYGLFI